MLDNNFYRAFEEKYYAPREFIRELRKQYLPFVEPLVKLYENCNTFDLGCGRGEWLELMQDNGFKPYGVDLDEGMLQACYERNLPVSKGNAIDYIKSLESESQVIISAFHVVEHISFEDLQVFVQEALRVLKPAGILIMETPNPENIKVATENFYLDPTHIKPIPSKLLSFLTEFYGYTRTKVLRLQESKELASWNKVNLLQVIEGVSPDYAIIAQKDADKEMLEEFDEYFDKDFGLSMASLSEKFDNRLLAIEARTTNAEARATEAEIKATEAEIKATEAEIKASEAEIKATEAEARAVDAWQRYHIIENSNSWKITKPLRLILKYIKDEIPLLSGRKDDR